jgi:NAD(P)-dependent dehydrogenase (short-subunit alcohol dehydrogenase family)
MTNKLSNKVAVITGGNSGIGLATAKEFAAQGAQVVILARTNEKLDHALTDIGHGATGYIGDVTNLESLTTLYQNVADNHGKIDIVFANAGIFLPTMIENTDEALFSKVSDINFKGAFFTVKYAVPYLNEGASVILVSSCLNEMGMEGASVYNATKAAVRSLARSFTPELKKINARINVLSPGPVETAIQVNSGLSPEDSADVWNMFADKLPAGRVGQPIEMAKTALFLASDDSSFLYGSEIQADGGMNQVRW